MKIVHIYTDGACRGNPGPGGWGVFIVDNQHEQEHYGAERETTNNRMELTATIKGLQAVQIPCHIVLTTDSQYVIKGITEWLPLWKKKGWKTAAKMPVKNQDLWELLDKEIQSRDIKWDWVRGHNGHVENERADKLANKAIDELL